MNIAPPHSGQRSWTRSPRLIKVASGYRALRVHRRCVHLLAELQGGYQYAPGNATHDHETPLDRDNHGADALRYWAWMRARRT